MPIHVSNADVTKNPKIIDSISASYRITQWCNYFVFKWENFKLNLLDKEVYRLSNNLIAQIEKDVVNDQELRGNYKGVCMDIIDPQVDFVDGSFARGKDDPAIKPKVQALKVASHVALYIKMKGGLVLASKDLHPPNSVTFTSTYTSEGSPFRKDLIMAPCQENAFTQGVMENTWIEHSEYYNPNEPTGANYHPSFEKCGARFHSSFSTTPHAVTTKGLKRPESYSTFFDVHGGIASPVHAVLQKNKITRVYFGGLCTDYCAGQSAAHAAMLGFKSTLLAPASAGFHPQALENLRNSIPLLEQGNWRRDINNEQTLYNYRQDVVPQQKGGLADNGVYYKPDETLRDSPTKNPQLVIMTVPSS